MDFAISALRLTKPVTFAAAVLALAGTLCARAGELAVTVVDRLGRPVPEVVITLVPLQPWAARTSKAPPPSAVMDQRNLAFAPRVLAIAVGTKVEFPNNDSVSHQVYSFSAAKRFQLPLYKGEAHPPVQFDREGLVVLGCNIHDQMAGYIYVTAAPWFGTTGADGMLRLGGVAAGEYRIEAWSPLIADPPGTLVRTVRIEAERSSDAHVQLTRDLRSRPEPRPRPTDWEY
ncbi:MAG TPA: methylamine utilization protein [Steroidobacteraceae bacterium]|nr:methylamine utilization protein [Steroidobacteraceae bacterium]